jgi:putative colanic acid biosynthesis UDP-glucose lipid carrier transferase
MNAAVDERDFERHRASRAELARAKPDAMPRASVSPIGSRSSRDRASPGSYEITQPVLFKGRTALAASLLLLRVVAPSAVAIATLYALIQMHGLPMTRDFTSLLAVACVLAALLLQQPRKATTQLLAPEFPAVMGLMLRWAALLGVLLAIGYVTGQSADYPRRVIVTWAVVTPVFLIAVTFAIHRFARAVIAQPRNARSVVLVGCTETSLSLAQRLARHPELCMNVRGCFDDRDAERLGPSDLKMLGRFSDLPRYVKENKIDAVFIALPLRHMRRMQHLLNELCDTTASLYFLPDVFVFDLIQARSGEILGVPVVSLCETPFHGFRPMAKRVLDVVLSSIAVVALAPLLLATAIAVRLSGHGPIIYRQKRYGLDGREITIYKFRTMFVTEPDNEFHQATRNDNRVTPIGRFLRRTSIDELPQLINVLQGRMSLVGPRPHAVAHNEETRRLIRGYMLRHKVPPGITGLAQIKGYRGETSRLTDMHARVHYDLEYVRTWSLWLDIKILLKTVPQLIRTDKAY